LRNSGGSNGHKLRAWKLGLQMLADEIGCRSGLPLSARHEQVEQIEHRLFSFISLN
jgi:hypothetical protein